jgi:hypothetical protein
MAIIKNITANVGKDEGKRDTDTLVEGRQISTTTIENSMEAPQKAKNNYHVIQQCHTWAYI